MGVLVLRRALLILLTGVSAFAWASGEDLEPDPHDVNVAAQAKFLCTSTEEYVKTLKFFRTSKEFQFPENTSRLISEKVARGCNGASERFTQVLLLLKAVGLSERKSLEMA